MLARIGQVAGVVAVVGGVLWIGFAVSFQTKFPPVQDAIRKLNRSFTNPRAIAKAGQPGSYASIVHHVGRVSGTDYRTPVVVVPAEAGLLIALPYGPKADWVRNVVAAGKTTIEHEGETLRATQPRLLPRSDANPYFPVKEQWMHRVYGVDDFLLLQAD